MSTSSRSCAVFFLLGSSNDFLSAVWKVVQLPQSAAVGAPARAAAAAFRITALVNVCAH